MRARSRVKDYIRFIFILLSCTVLISTMGCSTKQEAAGESARQSKEQADSSSSQVTQRLREGKPKLSTCSQDECEPWTFLKNMSGLCRMSVAIYQRSAPLKETSGMSGSETRWALLIPPAKTPKATPPPLPETAVGWRTIWEGVVNSESIPRGPGETVFSQSQLIPVDHHLPLGDGQVCRVLKVVTTQQARSFHRVDAREREFDEENVETTLFAYQKSKQRYIKQVSEPETTIKVRMH